MSLFFARGSAKIDLEISEPSEWISKSLGNVSRMDARWIAGGRWAYRILLLGLLFGVVGLSAPARAADSSFYRGDANSDGALSLADVFTILRHMHLGESIGCEDAADVDDSGHLDLVDPLYLVGTLFYRHSPIPPPYKVLGTDSTLDSLSCESGPRPVLPIARDAKGADDRDAEAEGAASFVRHRGPCESHDDGVADLEFIHFRRHVEVIPGQRSVRVPVQLTTTGAVEGFTLSFHSSAPEIRFKGLDVSGAVYDRVDVAPAWVHEFDGQLDEGFLALTAAMTFGDTFATLPALHDQTIAWLEFGISDDARPGDRYEIEFHSIPETATSPAIVNELSRDGRPQFYSVCDLRVDVVEPTELFVRGDVNRDGSVNLSDVVGVLAGLYQGAGFPCEDAADFDDDGSIVISDAISLALHLFAGGRAPFDPYPQPGRDSQITDSLGCE